MKSAFQTALALRAAWAATVDPDLAVSTDDIVFTPEDITGFPRDVDVTVTVTTVDDDLDEVSRDVPVVVIHQSGCRYNPGTLRGIHRSRQRNRPALP